MCYMRKSGQASCFTLHTGICITLHLWCQIWRYNSYVSPQAHAWDSEVFPGSESESDIYPRSPLHGEHVTARWRFLPCLPSPTVGMAKTHPVPRGGFEISWNTFTCIYVYMIREKLRLRRNIHLVYSRNFNVNLINQDIKKITETSGSLLNETCLWKYCEGFSI